MTWKLNKEGADFSRWGSLTNSEREKWDQFQNEVHNYGRHPRDAAQSLGSSTFYKNLIGNQFQIRLSGGTRATFLVDDSTETVTVLQVGGHT